MDNLNNGGIFQFNNNDMNTYPNILTPPMDSSEPIIVQQPMVIQYQAINIAPAIGKEPCLKIIEQPVEKFRFRYKSEMTGMHGTLCARSAISRKPTYPTVALMNYHKPSAIIRCSINQIKHDKGPHAHRLVRKNDDQEKDDPHDITVRASQKYTAVFHSMGIIHTAKKGLPEVLTAKLKALERESIERREGRTRELNTAENVEIAQLVEKQAKTMNFNMVCLKFEAFELQGGVRVPICKPVYSNPINNLKSALTGELKIVRMSEVASPVEGGKEIFMFVEKVMRKNIKVRFFELDADENEVWEDFAKFSDLDVHHQYAIALRTPQYKDQNIDQPVKVFVQLERPSDDTRSDPKQFTYTPCYATRTGLKRPRPSTSTCSSIELPATLSTYNNSAGLSMEVGSCELNLCIEELELQQSDEFRERWRKHGDSYTELLKENGLFQDAPRDVQVGFSIGQPSGVSHAETDMYLELKNELASFVNTKPDRARTISMLQQFFRGKYVADSGNTGLHQAVLFDDTRFFLFIVRLLIMLRSQIDIVDRRNANDETVLHLLAYKNKPQGIKCLLLANADVSLQDRGGNTALHIGVRQKCLQVLQVLLQNQDAAKRYIDQKNNEGSTALHLAVKTNYLQAVWLLCERGADVNAIQDTDGNTVLHLAVIDHGVQILEFLQKRHDLNYKVSNFKGYTAHQLATALDRDHPRTEEVQKMFGPITNETEIISTEVFVKEELDEEDDEMQIEIKTEVVEEFEPMKVNSLPEQLLCQICDILDRSGKWKCLAKLLKLEHLIRHNLISSAKGVIQNIHEDDDVETFRNYLAEVKELEAVSIMDNYNCPINSL